MTKANDERNLRLREEVGKLTRQMKEGNFEDIDLTFIEQEAPEMAQNFSEIISHIQASAQVIADDSHDLPMICEHLQHISESTEAGVLTVINTAEAFMQDAGDALDILEKLKEATTDNQDCQEKLEEVAVTVNGFLDKSFSILTSLEFEDINRQLLEKILRRINEVYETLTDILTTFRVQEKVQIKDDHFLNDLKRIIDIDASRQSQDMIDDLFESFDS